MRKWAAGAMHFTCGAVPGCTYNESSSRRESVREIVATSDRRVRRPPALRRLARAYSRRSRFPSVFRMAGAIR